MTDFRALCIELTDCLEKADWPFRYRHVFRQWVDIARAALADEPAVPEGREPAAVTEQPSDEDLLLSAAYAIEPCHIRWGNPAPQPPAEGEVAELVALLRAEAKDDMLILTPADLLRAADLLQCGQSALHRLHRLQQENARFREPERTILCDILANGTLLPDPDGKRYGVQPVPVSERLPGPEDCDAEGRCWLHLPDMGTEPLWRLTDPALRSRYHSHWLPFTALPLPSGEVE